MTLMQPTHTLVAADHADALLVARRTKTTLCTLLWFVLGTQLTLFFMLRYWEPVRGLITSPMPTANGRATLQYFVGLLDFAGLVLPTVLLGTVLVVLLVQVVARVAGTGRTTSALTWAVLLTILLFPWQAVLNNPALATDDKTNAIGMKVPGVLYTWAEVSHPAQGATFAEVNAPDADKFAAGLHWARYGLFPLLAMVMVGIVHTKTARGLRQSFGTDVVVADVDDAPVVTAVETRL